MMEGQIKIQVAEINNGGHVIYIKVV